MKTIYILLAIILSGCTCNPPIEVKVPVAISCITVAPTSPTIATSAELIALAESCKSGSEASCYQFVTITHADRLNLQAYRLKSEAVMSGCVVR